MKFDMKALRKHRLMLDQEVYQTIFTNIGKSKIRNYLDYYLLHRLSPILHPESFLGWLNIVLNPYRITIIIPGFFTKNNQYLLQDIILLEFDLFHDVIDN